MQEVTGAGSSTQMPKPEEDGLLIWVRSRYTSLSVKEWNLSQYNALLLSNGKEPNELHFSKCCLIHKGGTNFHTKLSGNGLH